MMRTKRKRRRHYFIEAYVYYPHARLFDLGEALGTIDQEPLYFMLDGRSIAPSADGSVFMTPKQARRMVQRSDFANYRSYALAEAPDGDLAGEPDGSARPTRRCPGCGCPSECVNESALSFVCENCLHEEEEADVGEPPQERFPRTRDARKRRRRRSAKRARKSTPWKG